MSFHPRKKQNIDPKTVRQPPPNDPIPVNPLLPLEQRIISRIHNINRYVPWTMADDDDNDDGYAWPDKRSERRRRRRAVAHFELFGATEEELRCWLRKTPMSRLLVRIVEVEKDFE